MRHHLLVVLEKKIKMLKLLLSPQKKSITGCATITLCTQTVHITNICTKSGLIIFNTIAVTLHTDTRRKQDA